MKPIIRYLILTAMFLPLLALARDVDDNMVMVYEDVKVHYQVDGEWFEKQGTKICAYEKNTEKPYDYFFKTCTVYFNDEDQEREKQSKRLERNTD